MEAGTHLLGETRAHPVSAAGVLASDIEPFPCDVLAGAPYVFVSLLRQQEECRSGWREEDVET